MNAATELIECDRVRCPVCGALTKSEIVPNKATCEATCVHAAGTGLVDAILTWTCGRCGAQWLHGQAFDNDEPRG